MAGFQEFMNKYFAPQGKEWQYSRVEDETMPGGWQPTYNLIDSPVAAVADAASSGPSQQYLDYLKTEPFDLAAMVSQQEGYDLAPVAPQSTMTPGLFSDLISGMTPMQQALSIGVPAATGLGAAAYYATRPDQPKSRLSRIGALDLRPVGSQAAFDFTGGQSGMPNRSAAAGPMPQEAGPTRNPRQMDIFDQNVPPEEPPKQKGTLKPSKRTTATTRSSSFKERVFKRAADLASKGRKIPVIGGAIGALSIPIVAEAAMMEDPTLTWDQAYSEAALMTGADALTGMMGGTGSMGDADFIGTTPGDGMFQGFSFVPYQK